MQYLISKLPEKFQWSIHNIIGHPIAEILHLVGLDNLSQQVHDLTLPPEQDENHVPSSNC